MKKPASLLPRCLIAALPLLLAGGIAFPPAVSAQETVRRQPERGQWMLDGKWGVMVHYLADWRARVDDVELSPESWNDMVDNFDVDGLADQLESVGAGYFLITLGQNSGYFLTQNPTYVELTGVDPDKLSRRDLVSDLYDALEPRGIKLMVYLPSGAPSRDSQAVEALEWRRGPYRNREFQLKWEEIIRDWSEQWGDRVAGWWFDGTYWPNAMYRYNEPPNYQSFADAARAGNPDAVVAFNPGVVDRLLSVTPYEDYTAGELTYPDRLMIRQTTNNRVDDAKIPHVLTHLGERWGSGEARFDAGDLADWSRDWSGRGAVISWEVPVQPNGLIDDAFIERLAAIGDALETRNAEGEN